MPPPTTMALARSTAAFTPSDSKTHVLRKTCANSAPEWLVLRNTCGMSLLRPLAIHRFREQRGQVDHLQPGAGVAHAVIEHHGAEGTADRKRVRARGRGLAHALLVDGTAALLHPHPRSARAAAERSPAVARHLHRRARGGGQRPRRFEHVVVASEVARVVVGDLALAGLRLELPLPHQL